MTWDTALPFGMRDTKITPFTTPAATALGTGGDYPNARSLSFAEAEDFAELRGDDKLVALRGLGGSVDWDMEHGGITVPAYKNMNGGTVTTTGVTPSQKTTYAKKVTDSRPYFYAEGQSMSDNGGDFHVILYKAKASGNFAGELTDGNFWLTSASGRSLPSTVVASADALYDFVLNETAAAIT
jgi:hypothetical protein